MDNHVDFSVIEAYRTGEASAYEKNHIERCDSCKSAINGLTSVSRIAKNSSENKISVPHEVDIEVLSMGVREMKNGLSKPVIIKFRSAVMAMAAAMLVGIGIWTKYHGIRVFKKFLVFDGRFVCRRYF